MDNPTPSESSAPFDWQIQIGEGDFGALKRSGLESHICYFDMAAHQGPPACSSGSWGLEDAFWCGHADCLLYWHGRERMKEEHGDALLFLSAWQHFLVNSPPACPSGCGSFQMALGSDHADCISYWHSKRALELLQSNVNRGDHALRRYMEQHPDGEQVARWPSAEALMYLHDILNLKWDAGTCAAAAAADSIACLSYAHCSGSPWDASVCNNAAAAGSMACLMYAHEHGCDWNVGTCKAAAMKGHLHCLVYARTHGCQWDERTCSMAAATANLEVLQYAFENGCPWNEATCFNAALAGSIECLAYAHELGCPWGARTCEGAAEFSLQCLQYAHERGCCWDDHTLCAAAKAGNLDCLMYAHKHACPYSIDDLSCCNHGLTIACLREDVSLQCLKYVRESMGCSWAKRGYVWGTEWRYALWSGRFDVLEYIHMHGGDWCGEEELLGIAKQTLLGGSTGLIHGRARCLLYMYCWGGCKLPPLKGTPVGDRMLALMQEGRAAVMLSFRAAGRARGGGRSAHAAHAAMALVPAELIIQILCAAKLLYAGEECPLPSYSKAPDNLS